MSDRTSIEWTDATWNTIGGCTRVDEGCRNCYAEVMAVRFNGPGQWGEGLAQIVTSGGVKDHRWTGQVRFNDRALTAPLRWKRPRRIFVNSTADTFHESVPDEWIDRIFAVMALCPQHQFQVLTKRPDRARAYLQALYSGQRHVGNAAVAIRQSIIAAPMAKEAFKTGYLNVWLGTSISDQASANARIPELLACPAAVRFISAEPLLGPLDLECILTDEGGIYALSGIRSDGSGPSGFSAGNRLDWVIVGGESGPGARPMPPDWARSLRDQCQSAGVAFFFKQWGEWGDLHDHEGRRDWMLMHQNGTLDLPDDRWPDEEAGEIAMVCVGKSRAGRLLDGREWNDMPGCGDA